MNILFFLTPKSQVVCVNSDFTIRQVSEKLKYHHYTAVPILDKDGKYVGTISDGDLFWFIKENGDFSYKEAEDVLVSTVPLSRNVKPISYSASMEDLYQLVLDQNFVPVIDDQGIFIGIVTRNQVLKYFYNSKDNN